MLKQQLKDLRTLAVGKVIQSRQLITQIELEETEPPALATGLIFVLGALAVALVIWAAVAKVDERSVAPGRVIPEGDTLAIQHLEGGVVSAILVKEGEVVDAGQPLIRLSPIDAEAELHQLNAQLVTTMLEIERRRAIGEGRRPDFSAYAGVYGDLMRDQEAIYQAERNNFLAQTRVLEAQLAQQAAEEVRLHNKIASLEKEQALLEEELKVQKDLSRRGLGVRTALLGIERQFEATRGQLTETRDTLVRTEASIREVEERLKEITTTHRQDALGRVGELSSKAAQLEQEIKVLTDRAERRVVVSPMKGVVQSLNVTALNAVIRPGEPFAEIVPLTERLLVEARIDPRDIGHIHVGQAVDLNISTFDFSSYGSIPGKLIRLSATTFQTDKGEQYFLATIEPGQTVIGPRHDPKRLLPGMTVEAHVTTGEKSILDYLLKPINRGMSRAFHER